MTDIINEKGPSSTQSVEAVILAGGSSRRMGRDKALIDVNGQPQAVRIASELSLVCSNVTVLGGLPVSDLPHMPDGQPFSGPLTALAGFVPIRDFVMVVSCDLPRFDGRVVSLLLERIGSQQAAIPSLAGRLQPLCGLYDSSSWDVARAVVSGGSTRMMDWIDRLSVREVADDAILLVGLDPRCVANANTREELDSLLGD